MAGRSMRAQARVGQAMVIGVMAMGLIAVGCGDAPGDVGPAGDAALVAPDATGAAPVDGGARDAAAPDAAAGCPSVWKAFELARRDSHSNVCVPGATCTFEATAGECAGTVTCNYELAGVETADIAFVHGADGRWHARFDTAARTHEFVFDATTAGLAYRIRGDIDDRNLCMFTNAAVDEIPGFPVTGACPDLTRAYRVARPTWHSCSKTLRCGLYQHADDGCVVDGFCTTPTGTTLTFAGAQVMAVDPGHGWLVGDLTDDPRYPKRYEMTMTGDFAGGTGGATGIAVDYYFGDAADPTCQWLD